MDPRTTSATALTAGGGPRSWRQTARRWGLITLLITGLGLLNFGIQATSWLAEHSHTPARYALLWEMTGSYCFLALLPVLLAMYRRFPLERANLATHVPLYLLAMAALSVVQTLLMWGSRVALYRLLGWGAYDYGDMRYRFFMEGFKLLLAYWGVYFVVATIAATRRERERAVAAARLEQQLSEARLAALKMQLNPHFLFNTLNMISTYIGEDPRVADAMVTHLSDFLRVTLRHADVQEVPLEQELEFLDAYLAIMKARFEDRLTVETEIAPELRRALVPHLVLQPLVENAVTHAMGDPDRAGVIRVSASSEGERLVLTVADNGPGLAAAAGNGNRRGVGLSNTAERLRHLYGAGHRLELGEAPGGGVRVVIEIPRRLAPVEGAA